MMSVCDVSKMSLSNRYEVENINCHVENLNITKLSKFFGHVHKAVRFQTSYCPLGGNKISSNFTPRVSSLSNVNFRAH